MILDVILLFLMAAAPYYLYLEQNGIWDIKTRPIYTALGMLGGLLLISLSKHDVSPLVIIIATISAIFTLFQSYRTTNLYRTITYLLFMNSPLLLTMPVSIAMMYMLSLLSALSGLYAIAFYLERRYESANYSPVTGTIIFNPLLGTIWVFYLLAIGLYPPMANNLFYVDFLLHKEIHFLEYFVALTTLIANFIVAMRIVLRSVFGSKNKHLTYYALNSGERNVHALIITVMAILSTIALREVLV